MSALDRNPYMELAKDLNEVLAEESPEVVIEALALLLGYYLEQCQNPATSAMHAQRILITSIGFNPQPIKFK